MNKSICILACAFIMLFTPSCNYNSDETNDSNLVYNGQAYEQADSSWYPINELSDVPVEFSYNDSYYTIYTYIGDEQNIFIKNADTFLFEGIIYHKESDDYPNYYNTQAVSKVVLNISDTDDKKIELEENVSTKLLGYLRDAEQEKNTLETDKVKSSGEIGFLEVYFNDYPAYQSDWILQYTQNGDIGLSFALVEKNTKCLGDSDRCMVLPDDVAKVIIDETSALK